MTVHAHGIAAAPSEHSNSDLILPWLGRANRVGDAQVGLAPLRFVVFHRRAFRIDQNQIQVANGFIADADERIAMGAQKHDGMCFNLARRQGSAKHRAVRREPSQLGHSDLMNAAG